MNNLVKYNKTGKEIKEPENVCSFISISVTGKVDSISNMSVKIRKDRHKFMKLLKFASTGVAVA